MAPPRLQVLDEVARELGAARDVDALVDAVLAATVTATGADRALLALFDPDGRVRRVRGHGIQCRVGDPLPVSNSVVADVLRDGVIRHVAAPAMDAFASGRESVRDLALRYLVVVPITLHGSVSGVLYADSRSAGIGAGPDREPMLRALAGLAGLALENEELSREQELRATALSKLVHDLASPLLVLEVAVRSLADDGADHELLGEVTTALRAMRSSIRTASRLQGTTRAEEQTELLHTGAALSELCAYLSGLAHAQGVTLRASSAAGLPPIRTWPDRVRLVLENLVTNAIKHATVGSEVHIHARAAILGSPVVADRRNHTVGRIFAKVARIEPDPAASWVELVVENTGDPIPEDIASRVFDEWFRGPRSSSGSGLGLAIADRCARSLGGSVQVEAAAGPGRGPTRFVVRLPSAGTIVSPR